MSSPPNLTVGFLRTSVDYNPHLIEDYRRVTPEDAIETMRIVWLKKESLNKPSKEMAQSALEVLKMAYDKLQEQTPKNQQLLWNFKVELENQDIEYKMDMGALFRNLTPPVGIVLYQRQIPKRPPFPVYPPTENNKRLNFLEKLLTTQKVKLTSLDGSDFVHASPQTKEDEDAQKLIDEQEKFMRSILTLFFQDYLFPEPFNDAEFNQIFHEKLTNEIQPHLKKVVKTFCFPEQSKLDDSHKVFLQKCLNRFHLFVKHLASTYNHWYSEKQILLYEHSLDAEEQILLDGLNKLRAKMNLPSILLPDMHSVQQKSELVKLVQRFIGSYLNRYREQYKLDEQQMLFAYISGPIFAIKVTELLYKIFSNETIFLLIYRLINNEIVLKPIEPEPPVNYFKASDPNFSKAVGELVSTIANDLMTFIQPHDLAKYGVKKVREKISDNQEKLGDFVQKALERILQTTNRLGLFNILSLLLWRQKDGDWDPYYLNSELVKKVSSNKSQLEEQFTVYVYNIVLNLIQKEKGDLASLGFKQVGSFEDYVKQLSKVIFRLLQQRSILLMGLVYITEAFDEP